MSINSEFLGFRTKEQLAADSKFLEQHIRVIKENEQNYYKHGLVTLKKNSISHILFLDFIYKKILDVPGVVIEFGVQWGASTSILLNLHKLYEPQNLSRSIIGFDTFTGFNDIGPNDSSKFKVGDYSVPAGWEKELEKILEYHCSIALNPHYNPVNLVKGDVEDTLPKWLKGNPNSTIGLVFFDLDLYSPTKFALENVMDRTQKGSILVFDEFNDPKFPGEALAVREILGQNFNFKRFHFKNYASYVII